MEDRQRDLMVYRMQQARNALDEANLLYTAKHPLGAVNRAYYAMFYAIQALLAAQSLEVSKHTGAVALFDREFVRTGIFPKGFSRWLHELLDLRHDSDYSDMFMVSEEQAKESLEHAQVFVEGVENYLNPGTVG